MPGTSTAPIHEELLGRLRAMVAARDVGDRLPAERELSQRWGVARMTLRRAVDTLIAEGVLERRHGSGTYVMPRPMVRALGLTSFSQDMAERGLIPGSTLLSFRTVRADDAMAAQLRIAPGEPLFRFTRLRLGSGEAMAVETTWLPEEFVPGLTEADLDGSLYKVLARRYGIITGSARVAIAPVLPDARVRQLLGIPAHQACLRMHMVDSDLRGRVIMVAHCVYRGDKYQLTAEVSGGAFSGSARRTG